ncbi:hypothetical protein GV828_06050 [Flavobacterium sp. NST-5]|uniref:Lipoprotein n=2 Tax=Flavobacterium ichthyis TaxID=2698827 RepID=A0ABW9Z7A5_9FLAO|nr:hypothetical protein [Flavobacterium ichthyis]
MKKLFKIINVLVLAMCVSSCSVREEINKDNFRRMSKNFSGRFFDVLDTIKNTHDDRILTSSLLKNLSNIDNIDYSKPIHIAIFEKELQLKFNCLNEKSVVLIIPGQRYRRRFVFYTNYETVSFPVLFITKEMTKYTIYLPDENQVMFRKHNVNEGMLLLFGAGFSYHSNANFKLLPNE